MNEEERAATVLRSVGYPIAMLDDMTAEQVSSLSECLEEFQTKGFDDYKIDGKTFYKIMASHLKPAGDTDGN